MRLAKKSKIAVLSGILLSLLACGPTVRVLTDRQQRILQAGNAWNRYSPADQALIRQGRFRIGLDELALYLSRGKPVLYWDTTIQGRSCRVILHDYWSSAVVTKRPAQADLAVYVCGGTIVAWRRIDPVLPCWRLHEVARRFTADLAYFRSLPLSRQWELVAGILQRGQTARDLRIAFGKPYNTGVQAREDGTNATEQVYLDSTGEAYGLHTTLVNGRLVAWRVPAERRLTPEAQARRLRAMEQRLMSRLKQMEARAIRRHNEEMTLLNRLQVQKTQMLRSLTRVSVGRGQYRGVLPNRPGTYHRRTLHSVSGGKTLTLNGKTFHDGPNGALGQPCGATQSDGSCPSGYTCYIMVGRRGVCVPSDQGN